MCWFRLVLCMVFFGLIPSLEAKSIEALFILDMKQDIKKASVQNGALMKEILQGASQAAGIPLHLTILQGKNITAENIQKYFRKLKNKPQDIMAFYFSGHGMKNKKKTPWPCMYLSKQNRFLDMADVISVFRSAKPRLSIVLTDCCNSKPTFKQASFQEKASYSFDQYKLKQGLKKLFTNTRGRIYATAATPGQFGLATDKGSVFTVSFVSALCQTTQTSKPTWSDVFSSTSSICTSLNAKFFHSLQIPYVELQIK